MDFKFIETNRDRVEKSLKIRGSNFDLGPVEALSQQRRKLQSEQDERKSRLNTLSSEIGQMMRTGSADPEKVGALKSESAELKREIQELDGKFTLLEGELKERLLYLPNVLHESVVEGKSAEDNPVIRTWGEPKNPVAHPKTHDDLGVALGILDFERAAKVTGARFTFLMGWAARLERALLNFMMETHRERGYTEIWPPFLVNRESMIGTGQLPKFAEEAFRISDPEFYLIPTAEVPVTNLHRGEILNDAQLPLSYVAFSPCFRREAGSYGKDTKGLIRQHQFDKVELVKFVRPEESYAAHDQLTADAEEILKRLELSYRVISLCSGDIGFGAAKTYDLEVWLPGQNAYREISSCSNYEDFQARRADIRYRPAGGGKPQFAHTLNGSGLALGRTLIAVMENGQQEDGSISIPRALQPYVGGHSVIPGNPVRT